MNIFKGIPKTDLILILIGILAMFYDFAIGTIVFWILFTVILVRHRDAIYGFLGNIQYHNKHYSKAINWYKTCSKFSNCSLKRINTYVFLEIKFGSVEKAEETLNKIIENRNFSEEEMKEINVTKALLEWGKGDNNAALEILYKELEKEERPVLFETISYLLLLEERYDDAFEFTQKAHEKIPEDYIITSNLAISYYHKGNVDKCFNILKPLCDHGFQLLEPYYYAGLIAKEKGDIESSYTYLKKGGVLPETILKLVPKETLIKLYKEVSAIKNENESSTEIAASSEK